jgi:hypothetical protein
LAIVSFIVLVLTHPFPSQEENFSFSYSLAYRSIVVVIRISFAGAGLQPVSNYGVEFSTQLARQGQELSESGFTGLKDWQDCGLCYSYAYSSIVSVSNHPQPLLV